MKGLTLTLVVLTLSPLILIFTLLLISWEIAELLAERFDRDFL